MNKKIFFNRSIKDIVIAIGPSFLILVIALIISYKFLDPAPPNHLVIGTGEADGDYQLYAKQYQDILKKDGVTLELRPTEGPVENLKLLNDDNSDVEVGFVQDGIGSEAEQPGVVSLGSLYYEPIWLFYRGPVITKFSQLRGKKIAIGRLGHETRILTSELLDESGVDKTNSQLFDLGHMDAADDLKSGDLDAAFFMLQPDDPLIVELMSNRDLHLMNLDQTEAFVRKNSSFHHLVLPHGAIDIKNNIPNEDVNILATTTTLLANDDIHPALTYLLLKAAKQIHSGASIFEKKNEFPADRDDEFPISSDAKQFYNNGGPFWQRYLPFWLAAWVDRFFIVGIPLLALLIPLAKLVPKFYHWRIKKKIYKFYGELRYLETQMKIENTKDDLLEDLRKLDVIEDNVNRMKLPLDYVEHTYSLRGHIDFVRAKIRQFKN